MNDEKRVCKGICKKFKVKRPSNGKRYDSGQGRCQICEQWIDHRGAHFKNNSIATENSTGWYCNCCNYRVRQKPRNKVYKEKLAADNLEKKEKFELINQNPCPKCGIVPTAKNVESVFGMRTSGGKSIRQSYCRECRSIKSLQTIEKETTKKTKKLNIDEINKLISDALFLIRKNASGIYENALKDQLRVSEKEFKEIFPKIIRLEDIVEEVEDLDEEIPKKILKSIHYENNMEIKILEFILQNEPANPYEIAKKFQKVNLASLERDGKIEWDKIGKGWTLTLETKEKLT